jgi:hypothetical protein
MNVRNVYETMQMAPAGGGQELTVADEAVSAAAMPDQATHAWLSVKTNDVLKAFHATPVQGGAGILLKAGERIMLRQYALANAKFVRAETDKSAVIRIEPVTF